MRILPSHCMFITNHPSPHPYLLKLSSIRVKKLPILRLLFLSSPPCILCNNEFPDNGLPSEQFSVKEVSVADRSEPALGSLGRRLKLLPPVVVAGVVTAWLFDGDGDIVVVFVAIDL